MERQGSPPRYRLPFHWFKPVGKQVNIPWVADPQQPVKLLFKASVIRGKERRKPMEKLKKWLIVAGMVIFTGTGGTGILPVVKADEADTAAVENKVVVTAKSNQADHDIPVSTTIITAEEIKASNASSIKDILVQQAGISFGVNSASTDGRQSISIRGSSSDHVLILVDGQKVSGSDAQISHSDFQYNWVPMNAIERIEVVKGPMSSIYGSQAIGGVINIVTKKSKDKFYGDVDVKYGSSNDDGGDYMDVSLTVGGRIADRLSLSLSAERNDLDPAADEDDKTETKIEGKEIRNGLAKIQFDIDDTQYIEAAIGRGTEDRLKADDVLYYDIERQNYSLGYNKEFNSVTLDLDAYMVDSDSHYNTTSSSGGYTHGLTDKVARAEVDIASLKNNYIVAGAEFKKQEYEKEYDLAASASKNFSDDMNNTSAFFQDEINLGEWFIITLGTRYDYHEKFNGEWSPKAGILCKLGQHNRIKANYGEGFNAPTVTQNSSSYAASAMGITVYGNDDLQPETSRSFELGYEFFTDTMVFKASVYKTNVDNLITSETFRAGSRDRIYVNVDKSSMKGFECELAQDINERTNFSIGYHYLETEDESTGEELAYRPHNTVNIRLNTLLPWDIHSTFSASYTGSQTDGDEDYDGFIQFNAQVSRTFYDRFTVRLGVDNITDEDLDDAPYDIEGRVFYCGLNFRF